jgi:hypothetical protein
MNDVTFLEASRALAGRMVREGGSTEAERIAYGFSLVTARPPKSRESDILLSSFHYYRDTLQADSEFAAYTTVASLILNLDVTVTKE